MRNLFCRFAPWALVLVLLAAGAFRALAQPPEDDPPPIEPPKVELPKTPPKVVARPPRLVDGPGPAADIVGALAEPPDSAVGAQIGPIAQNVFVPPRRKFIQQIGTARDLLDQERYSEAVDFLQSILDEREDYFEPSVANPNNKSFRGEVERMIGRMPEAGRQAYELKFGPRADALLKDAVAQGELSTLEYLAARYFHTAAGYQAAWLLGDHHWQRGNYLAAAAALARLHQAPGGAALEPLLSAKLAACYERSGLPETAQSVLVSLKTKFADQHLEVGGTSIPLFTRDDQALGWLVSVFGPSSRAADVQRPAEWLVHLGNASRTAQMRSGRPLLARRWHVETYLNIGNGPQWDLANELQRHFVEHQVPALPAAQPLIVDGQVLVRTLDGLLAIDLETGLRRWPFLQNQPRRLIKASDEIETAFDAADQASNAIALENRLWNDQAFGLLSSDGELVFSVQDLGPVTDATILQNRNVFVPRGREQPVDPFPGNRLAALELKTPAGQPSQGGLRWIIGGPDEDAKSPLYGAFFLGPPLPLSGMLYCLVDVSGEVRLVALEGKTGRFLWSQQLALFDQPVSEDPLRRLAGATPSHADGVLVCPTAGGAVVAVDLTSRSLRWGYRYDQAVNSVLPPSQVLSVPGVPAVAGAAHWQDNVAKISSGRVILTPASSAHLHCLNLFDGSLLWHAPREDGLYVAGVFDGRVVTVGAKFVRAYDLASGKRDVWKRNVALPDHSVPSGRGYESQGKYYLPLSSAEIAVIDLEAGKIVDRIQSISGDVPGNLVAYRDDIVSQSADRIECFRQREPLERRAAEALAKNSGDPQGLLWRGELLLDEGKFDEAAEHFRRSYQAAPDWQARNLLVATLLSGLKRDFAKHRGALDELAGLLGKSSERAEYWQLVADGLRQEGDHQAAFEAYLQLAALDWDGASLERISDDPQRFVRRDRWIRARLNDVLAAAPAEPRAQMESQLEQRLQTALSADKPAALRSFLEFFGDQPLAEAARRALLDRLDDAKDAAEKARLLDHLAATGDAAVRGGALAHKAQLLTAAGRTQDAAAIYQRLATSYADVPCLNAQTGRQLLDALPADGDVRRWIEQASAAWPKGNVKSEAQEASPALQGAARNFAIPTLAGGASALAVADGASGAAPALNLFWDAAYRNVVAEDATGRELWKVAAFEADEFVPYVNQMVVRAELRGQLAVVELDRQVVAIDVLGLGGVPRVLWREDLIESLPGGEIRTFGARQERLPWGESRFVSAGVGGQAGSLGPVNEGYVALQRGDDVLALDPLSGVPLWKRTGIRGESRLYGDEQRLIVDPGDGSEALLLRASDGAEIGKGRSFRGTEVMETVGTRVLTWNYEDGKSVVEFVDAAQSEDDDPLWRHEFDRGAKATLIGREAVAVIDGEGRAKIIRLDEKGTVELETDLLEKERTLVEVFALRSADVDVLIANGPNRGGGNPVPGGARNPRIDGHLYAFDRGSGKLLWRTEKGKPITNQSIILDQPAGLPVLVLASYSYKRFGGPTPATHQVLCLDKRTGKLLYDNEQPNPIYGLAIRGDKTEGSVTIDTSQQRIRLTFEK